MIKKVSLFLGISCIAAQVHGMQLLASSQDKLPVTPRAQSLVSSLGSPVHGKKQQANDERLLKAINGCSADGNDTLPLVSYLITELQASVNPADIRRAIEKQNDALIALLARTYTDRSWCDDAQNKIIDRALAIYK